MCYTGKCVSYNYKKGFGFLQPLDTHEIEGVIYSLNNPDNPDNPYNPDSPDNPDNPRIALLTLITL